MDATPPPTPLSNSPVTDTSTGLTPNVAAGLACLFGVISGVIFLFIEKKNAFVRFWAMQATIFGGAMLVLWIVLSIAGAVLGAIPVLGVIFAIVLGLVGAVVGLAALVIWIMMLVKAFTGVEWRMPYIAKIADEQLARLPK